MKMLGWIGIILYIVPLFCGCSFNFGNVFGLSVFGTWLIFCYFPEIGFLLSPYIEIFFCMFVLLICLTLFVMIKTCCKKPIGDETMILLGCGLYGDRPSLALIERMECAISYLQSHKMMKVIACGGQGNDECISEAEAMKRYLIAHGIESERIIMETKSRNTLENICYAKQIIRERCMSKSVVIVTQSYHQYRASLYTQQFGLSYHALCAKERWYSACVYWSREWIAIWVAYVVKNLKKITKLGIK